jgi:hypothetical protein
MKGIYDTETFLVADKTEAINALKKSNMARFKDTGATALLMCLYKVDRRSYRYCSDYGKQLERYI